MRLLDDFCRASDVAVNGAGGFGKTTLRLPSINGKQIERLATRVRPAEVAEEIAGLPAEEYWDAIRQRAEDV